MIDYLPILICLILKLKNGKIMELLVQILQQKFEL